ncbi:NADH-quinone oxidoreductase subunit NuoN [Halorhodospira halophila]|uniref:NADH-quinone oxidoreductase subunit N n=1 Tax=Halorhodospira halophila (strain DSM 244 / SL1) TaxID=349124 RepID=NUON_HALHL|nr:NADH-quinone oxidoreductase subunit NuoN [Halorhodospira halophila]A1WXV4.1 RecName: Full=NADH-quinone oxidoreductase subunit N; AltName: Full=NADH dehydrogenase I subunit N; AltName: Full=NDH-1 subunit N [Halorhodospira halophila SL1]ABM62516.1 NADH dehydrogenase subunit N [Halorhodospira halophila SL1]MBK1728193.1 NADH-quinone oxidoreductase subunit N [Halorhodospira halophila]
MSFETPDFSLALPEIWLLAATCGVLVVDLFSSDPRRSATFYLTQGALLVTAVLALSTQWGVNEVTFSGHYMADSLGAVVKASVALLSVLALAYTRPYLGDRGLLQGEFYLLALFANLGMLVIASGGSLLSLYLGLELLSLALYALVAYHRDSRQAAEAAMKYFVLGSLASGILLYGMSMVYGATASLELSVIAEVAGRHSDPLMLLFGVVFMLVGVAFKLGAAPFHAWVPDVYQGAPTPVTLFLSTAPKVAAVALFMRLLVDGLGPMHEQLEPMLMILAVASLLVGNLIAIVQTNFKRMLAYSAIAHAGFIMVGFTAGTDAGHAAALFYTIAYSIMAAGAFGMITVLARSGFEAEEIADLRGLNERHPVYAGVLLLVLVSMTGIPGTVGFYAKYLVLQAAVEAGHIPLAIFAVVAAVVGAFYYLRVLKVVYFDRPEAEVDADTLPAPGASSAIRSLVVVNGVAVLVLGIFPERLIALCQAALGL